MGLCKCPKRKVTTQFCYEHRVNVCEHCVVVNHPKCVVQSYLLWLQDSDYSPECTLCKQNLSDEECARLSCYHVFHWNCLDQYVRDLPETTAPAGYKCPSCNESILPKQNSASPVADALREKLSTVNWGRIGLGLPLPSPSLDIAFTVVAPGGVTTAKVTHNRRRELKLVLSQKSQAKGTLSSEDTHKSLKRSPPNEPPLMNGLANKEGATNPQGTVVHMEENMHLRPESSAQVPRRNPHGASGEKVVVLDEDENKYRRRYGFLGLNLWFKFIQNQMNLSKKGPKGVCKLIILVVIIFFILCIILSLIGNIITQDDPAFDLHNNPNVRINNE